MQDFNFYLMLTFSIVSTLLSVGTLIYVVFKPEPISTLNGEFYEEIRNKLVGLRQDVDSFEVSQKSFKMQLTELLDEANLQFKRATGKLAMIEKREQQELERENIAQIQTSLFNKDFVIPKAHNGKHLKTVK